MTLEKAGVETSKMLNRIRLRSLSCSRHHVPQVAIALAYSQVHSVHADPKAAHSGSCVDGIGNDRTESLGRLLVQSVGPMAQVQNFSKLLRESVRSRRVAACGTIDVPDTNCFVRARCEDRARR